MPRHAGTVLLTLGALFVGALAPAAVGAEAADPSPSQSEQPAPIVIEAIDGSVDPNDPELIAEMEERHRAFIPGSTRAVAEPVVSWPLAAAGSSGMSVTFDVHNTPPAAVQTVVLAAIEKWDEVLATTAAGPVQVAVSWDELGPPGLLGTAGPNGLFRDSELPTESWYPTPLVNTLLGTDRNGSEPEVLINLNSASNWYVGTSGTPGFGQVDLFTTILHEMGHGVGFLGSASVSNHPGSSPTLDDPPFVYDEAVSHNGQRLLATSNPNELLQSNNLWIDLSSSLRSKLFVPGSWQEGSSFSHLDEATYPAGSPGALMTPTLQSGEVDRTLDSAVLGVLARIGWPLQVGAVTPTITSVAASSSALTVSWSSDLNQAGVAPDGHRVEALRNGVTLDASADLPASTTAVTLSGLQCGAAYTLQVVPHARGVDGTPAIQGFNATGAPTSPAIVIAGGATLSQTVSWSDAGGCAVSGYEVQRSTDGLNWFPIGSTAGLSLATSVSEGVHQYRVRGSNSFGAGAWGYSIPTGASAGVVRPVPLDGQIARLYRAHFLRDPDAVGFAYWLETRGSGASLEGIATVFSTSDEFVATYGTLNDTQFVDLLYRNVLGRPSDPEGLAHWVGILRGGASRGSVVLGFSESVEYIGRTGTVGPTSVAQAEIYRLYVAFFLRFPEVSGLQYWTSVRASGASLESIAAAFAGSAEFQNTYGLLPDASFVELVYNHVLGRPSDAGGRSFWLGQLAGGADRGAMMTGFSESAEFVVATGTIP